MPEVFTEADPAAQKRVLELLRDNPTGYRLLGNLGAAWRAALGDVDKGQAHIVASLAAQKDPAADQLAFFGARAKKASGAAAYGKLVAGSLAWVAAFQAQYFCQPTYPPYFFREGVQPPDTAIAKIDVPRCAALLSNTAHIQHGAIDVMQRLETHLAKKYPDDPLIDEPETANPELAAPEHVLDFRDGLTMAGIVIRFILSTPTD